MLYITERKGKQRCDQTLMATNDDLQFREAVIEIGENGVENEFHFIVRMRSEFPFIL